MRIKWTVVQEPGEPTKVTLAAGKGKNVAVEPREEGGRFTFRPAEGTRDADLKHGWIDRDVLDEMPHGINPADGADVRLYVTREEAITALIIGLARRDLTPTEA